MHSAGGFLGCNAIKGWGVERRRMDREDGGVRKLVFLAGGIVPEGSRHPESMPFFENDVSAVEVFVYIPRLSSEFLPIQYLSRSKECLTSSSF